MAATSSSAMSSVISFWFGGATSAPSFDAAIQMP